MARQTADDTTPVNAEVQYWRMVRELGIAAIASGTAILVALTLHPMHVTAPSPAAEPAIAQLATPQALPAPCTVAPSLRQAGSSSGTIRWLIPEPVHSVAPPAAPPAPSLTVSSVSDKPTVYLYGPPGEFGSSHVGFDTGDKTPRVVAFGEVPLLNPSYEALRAKLKYLGTAPAGLDAGAQYAFEAKMVEKYSKLSGVSD